jgi:hypothetical protein
MEIIEIEYNTQLRSLKIYNNGKLLGGCTGNLAQQYYNKMYAEAMNIDLIIREAKKHINGRKDKTQKKEI